MAAKAKHVQAVWQNPGDWAESKSEKSIHGQVADSKAKEHEIQDVSLQVIRLLFVEDGTRSKRKMV